MNERVQCSVFHWFLRELCVLRWGNDMELWVCIFHYKKCFQLSWGDSVKGNIMLILEEFHPHNLYV